MDENFHLKDIKTIAEKFLLELGEKRVVAFYGEMGAGKTTFIEQVCACLGVEETMSSPTFSIINQYSTASNEIIYHIDLYRLNDGKEAVGAGVEDCLYSGCYCFVEWPNKASGIFPEHTARVYIETKGGDLRNIKLIL